MTIRRARGIAHHVTKGDLYEEVGRVGMLGQLEAARRGETEVAEGVRALLAEEEPQIQSERGGG